MNQEKMHDLALMKYQAISPAISGLINNYSSLQDFCFDVSKKGIRAPDGTIKHFSAQTIERWYYAYKHNGFNALIPKGRIDNGSTRKLDDDIQEQIKYYKTNYPRITASSIYHQMISNGIISKFDVSLSTVNRYVNHLNRTMKTTNKTDMRRYERPHINEVWCGDTCVGSYLKTSDGKKHRVYIIALIDDASRYVVSVNAFFNDNFINLMQVIKSAVSMYGRPQMLNFDNGSSFKNKQMELLAARIGTVLHYDKPYTPIQKAKIERWFRTVRDHFLSLLDLNDFHSLEDFREKLFKYVNEYNNSPHSSLNGKTPRDRYFSEPNLFKRLSDEDIEKAFLLEIERRVSADNVVVIDQVEYEVDYRFSKQHITLRYSPDMKNIFVVESDGTLTPIKLLCKTDNAFIKREKVQLCKGDD